MGKLDDVFQMLYYFICDFAKWIFAIKMASDVIKNTNSGDIQSTIKGIISGGIGFGCLYSIVSFLDAIQAKFQ